MEPTQARDRAIEAIAPLHSQPNSFPVKNLPKMIMEKRSAGKNLRIWTGRHGGYMLKYISGKNQYSFSAIYDDPAQFGELDGTFHTSSPIFSTKQECVGKFSKFLGELFPEGLLFELK